MEDAQGGSFMLGIALGARAHSTVEKKECHDPFPTFHNCLTAPSQLQHSFRALSHHRYKLIAGL